MPTIPKDASDLLLAPIALQINDQLEQLTDLTQDELVYWVSLQTDREPRPGRRGELLIQGLTRGVETHDWTVTWDTRGLSLAHAGRSLVLGISDNVRTFMSADT